MGSIITPSLNANSAMVLVALCFTVLFLAFGKQLVFNGKTDEMKFTAGHANMLILCAIAILAQMWFVTFGAMVVATPVNRLLDKFELVPKQESPNAGIDRRD